MIDTLSKGHFFVGVLSLVIFLLTGIYMIVSFPELYEGREEVRMMYRATHIYILMSSLTNLMAGNYLLNRTGGGFAPFRLLASVLVLVSPILFVAAFIVEPPSYLIERPISFWGVLVLLLGVLLHCILNLSILSKYSNTP